MRGSLIGLAVVIVGVVALVLAPIPRPDDLFVVLPSTGLVGDRTTVDGSSTWRPLLAPDPWRFELRVGGRDVTLRSSHATTGAATYLDLPTTLDVRDSALRDGGVLLLGGGDARRGAVVERFEIAPFAGAVRRDERGAWGLVDGADEAVVVRREWFVDGERSAVAAVALDPRGETVLIGTDDGTLRLYPLTSARLDAAAPLATWPPSAHPLLPQVTGATSGDVTLRPFALPDTMSLPRCAVLAAPDALLLVPLAPPGSGPPPAPRQVDPADVTEVARRG